MSKSKKRLEVYQKFSGRCAYCGTGIPFNNFHVDHVIPKYRGGAPAGVQVGLDNIENLAPSCPSCNILKSTFTLDEFKNQIKLKLDRLRRDSVSFRLLERYNLIETFDDSDVVFYFEKVL